MGHEDVGTGYLTLGLLIEGENVAARVPHELGATSARAEIERLLRQAPVVPLELMLRRGPASLPKPAEVVSRTPAPATELGAARVGVKRLEQALMGRRARER